MTDPNTNTVTVQFADGQWWVTIIETGKIHEQTFDNQEHAENFAAGQRIRLGLEGDGT